MNQLTIQLLSKAREFRQQARRARRMAASLDCQETVERIRRYAERLDHSAARLEREAEISRTPALGRGWMERN